MKPNLLYIRCNFFLKKGQFLLVFPFLFSKLFLKFLFIQIENILLSFRVTLHSKLLSCFDSLLFSFQKTFYFILGSLSPQVLYFLYRGSMSFLILKLKLPLLLDYGLGLILKETIVLFFLLYDIFNGS